MLWKGCEGVVCKGWVGDGTNCNILTPSSSGHGSTSFLFCWAAQPGSWGPKPSVSSWFSLPRCANRTPTNWLQLTQAVCGTRLYNCLTSTCFMWVLQFHQIQPVKVIPWYLQPDAPVSWLTAGSKVNMLHILYALYEFCIMWSWIAIHRALPQVYMKFHIYSIHE